MKIEEKKFEKSILRADGISIYDIGPIMILKEIINNLLTI